MPTHFGHLDANTLKKKTAIWLTLAFSLPEVLHFLSECEHPQSLKIYFTGSPGTEYQPIETWYVLEDFQP